MAGLSLSLLVVVGLVAWRVVDDRPYVARPPQSRGVQAQPALAAQTLGRLQEAVDRRDPAAARALAPSGDDAAADLLAGIVTNAEALHLRDFTVRYVDEESAVSDAGAWTASVDVTWAFGGFDTAPADTEVLFHFVAGDGAVGLTGVGGGDDRSPLWLSGPLQVRRTPTTLVLVDGSRGTADGYARRADAAVPVVRRVVTDWRPRLVVEVPRTGAGLDRVLDAEPEQYANIAAVTTTADGSLAPDAPVHVFVNPDVFAQLQPEGAQVVMSHEATHVATDAALSSMPLWLLEGFADYVALRDVRLPIGTTAGQIIRQVRRDGPPGHLPGAAEFDTTTTHLGASYEAAWIACRVLADRGGERALVRLYDRVDDGTPLGRALETGFGLSVRSFTRAWQDRLSDLAA
ncbi:hypothetical protein H5V45_03700 [Nocardioides sp. KIGAM211]|uniref:Peptidase MA-like domain-containing protein n=1 Tax=Nocardioides luti TaxID=2761101 RepID=A0A7X0RFL3_9ACTN|nr:hypothetical protein [Nocardioides luti]MBB6626420.1 hypothetical protein [Nocardioides luti]